MMWNMFRVNNKNTRTTSFTSLWEFLLNFEHISYLFFSASIVDSLQVNHYSKMKFSISDFFSKWNQIRSFLRIWSYLLKKSLMEKSIFCTVWVCNIYLPIKLFVLAPKDLLEDFLDLLEDNSYLKSSANYWKYGTGI